MKLCTQDKVRRALGEVIGVDIDYVAADGLGRGQGQGQVLMPKQRENIDNFL